MFQNLFLLLTYSCVLLNRVIWGQPSAEETILTNTLNNLLNNNNYTYDRKVRPNYGREAVTVSVSMFLLNILKVSEVDMEFKTDIYFRQEWTDPRLAYFNHNHSHDKSSLPPHLKLDYEASKHIWTPDTFFPSERISYIHKATVKNEYIRVTGSGVILKSTRFTLSTTCPMHLKYFPMDNQICSIKIESYGYTTEDLIFNWDHAAINQNSIIASSQRSSTDFKVVGYRVQEVIVSIQIGNYSTLTLDVQFSRSMGFYLMQIYLPSSMLVVTSWFSFWMDRDSVADRISMCLTTMLTITMLLSNVNSASPKMPYVKAIDVYAGMCFMFIFASLLENAIVGYIYKKITKQSVIVQTEKIKMVKKIDPHHHKKQEEEEKLTFQSIKSSDQKTWRLRMMDINVVGAIQQQHGGVKVGQEEYKKSMTNNDPKANGHDGSEDDEIKEKKFQSEKNLPSYIDFLSRILFPSSFLVCNVIYWIYYLQASKLETSDLTYFETSTT